MVDNMNRLNDQNDEKLRHILRQGKYQAQASDRIIFQRFLGHFEILNGFRWHEVDMDECYICEKWAYSLVLWDDKLAKNFYRSIPRDELNFPIKASLINTTTCSFDSIQRVIPMISIKSFISRVIANQQSGQR